jgi:phage/conjugal plasmid C-4 type zinc finger TraR family protein
MTDITDRAAEQEELDRAVAMSAQRNRAGLDGKTIADSATDCTDCGEQIPFLRRQAMPGCQFCIDCQAHREKAFYER